MQTSQAITNEGGSDSAVAAQTFAHGRKFSLNNFTSGNSAEFPAASTVGYPSLFAVGRRDPNSRALFTMANQQRPLGFKFSYVTVINDLGAERVNHDKVDFAKNEFWSQPQQGCCACNQCCNDQVDGEGSGWVEDRLSYKEAVKSQRTEAPGKIAFWSEDIYFLHESIIAGTAANGIGNQK